MKKYLTFTIIIFLIIIFSFNSFALENMNGETWSTLNKEAKKTYLKGIVDGINFMIVSIVAESQPDIDIDLLATQLKREGDLIELTVMDFIEGITNIDNQLKHNPEKTVFDIIVEDKLGFSP